MASPSLRSRRAHALTSLLAALLVACGGGGDTVPSGGGPAPTVPVPDVAVTDVNPASATYGAVVSPRDFLGAVSAWYFGHAT